MFFTPVRVSRSVLAGYAGWPNAWSPVDVTADDTSITLSVDVPGLAKDHITVGIEGRIVRIRSKDDAPRSFQAAYKLGTDVDASQCSAKLEHGVLTLRLAKLAQASQETVLAID